MEIIREENILFVKMSREAALSTIKSLAAQLLENSPNIGRYEATCIDGTYFSIGVDPDPSRAPWVQKTVEIPDSKKFPPTRVSLYIKEFLETYYGNVTTYQYNNASIRVRVIDDCFKNIDGPARHTHINKRLENLHDESVHESINLMILLHPDEVADSVANRLFEQGVQQPQLECKPLPLPLKSTISKKTAVVAHVIDAFPAYGSSWVFIDDKRDKDAGKRSDADAEYWLRNPDDIEAHYRECDGVIAITIERRTLVKAT